MSYTPTEWTNGDVITAEKLNHIESGVEESYNNEETLLVTFTTTNSQDYTCDKTYSEIEQAIADGKIVIGRLVVSMQEQITGGFYLSNVAYMTEISGMEGVGFTLFSLYIESNKIKQLIATTFQVSPNDTIEVNELRGDFVTS